MVEVYEQATGLYLQCLAVSGSKLVSGACGSRAEVRVWGLAELDLQQTLPLSAGSSSVRALVRVSGEVWGGVGAEVSVWGKKKR